MSKIVFFCIPAHGHTNPTLGVVKELVSRGHQVWYYSYNIMREKIESAGATFISCDDYDTEQKLSAKDSTRVGKDLAFSTKILVDKAYMCFASPSKRHIYEADTGMARTFRLLNNGKHLCPLRIRYQTAVSRNDGKGDWI